jgi:hypothetical protein
VAVDGDPPTGHVVQAGHQCGEGGLAGPGGADECERRTGGEVEVDVAQDVGGVGGEPEADVLEPEVAAWFRQLLVAGLDGGPGVQDLADPVRRGHRLLGHRQDAAE